MPDTSQPGTSRHAVVLAGGGVVGTAWMAGLVAGLSGDDIDLAAADLVVGTSAGAIVGAVLATGQRLDRLAAPPRPTAADEARPGPDPARIAEVLRVLGTAGPDPVAARRHAGQLAFAADTGAPEAHVERMRVLLDGADWPERRLLITAVDAETGEPRVWDRDSGVPLADAVASSTAFPGAFPPIPINGRHYIDGGLRSATNADLAEGVGTLVVLEPLAHLFPREPLRRELAAVGATTVVTVDPDQPTIAAFGADPFARGAWQPAYQAGLRQATDLAGRLRGTDPFSAA